MVFSTNILLSELISKKLPFTILILLALLILCSIIFGAIQLASGKISEYKFKKVPLNKLWYLISGGILGGLLIGIFNAINVIYIDYDPMFLSYEDIIILQLFILISFSLMASFFISIFSLIITFSYSISILIIEGVNENQHLIIFLSISYFVAFISLFIYRLYLIISKKSVDKKNNLLFISIITSLIFVIYLISYNVNLVSSIYTFIFIYILALFLFAFLIVLFKNINKIIDNTYFLKKSIIYDDSLYVREEYSENEFLNFIKKNKINYGLLFKLQFIGTEKIKEKLGASSKKKVEEEIIKSFFSEIDKNRIFLKNGYNERLFFIPLDIGYNFDSSKIFSLNEIKTIEEILERKSTDFRVGNKKFKIQVKAYCSIYGINSNILNELNSYIENINENDYFENKNKNIYVYKSKNENLKNDWKLYQKLKRNNKIGELVLKNITINNITYVSPIYYYDDEDYTRNINYRTLETQSSLDRENNKVLLRIVEDYYSSVDNAKKLIRKINDNNFNKLAIYFYNDKKIKIKKNIINLFENNNIFIL